MADGKFTIDEYKRMEKFLGCDEESIKKRRLQQMQERRNHDDLDSVLTEALDTWKFLFDKKEDK